MKYTFDKEYTRYDSFKGGNKYLDAIMVNDEMNRFMKGILVPGASVGMHIHETNSEVIY